jgi:hypothetical protein
VQRRQHEVAGQRGAQRDVGGLAVTDLADEHDVGILAQQRAQAFGETEPDRRVDLRLAYERDLGFDRILDGRDLAGQCVDRRQQAVERGRLAGSGRTGDEQQTVRQFAD